MNAAKEESRLIVLSGPSCVGKSPLVRALNRLHPELAEDLEPLTLFNDRAPRPGEIDGEDYHFRRRETIAALENDPERYVVMDVRGDLQALDVDELLEDLRRGDVLFEGNPSVGRLLLTDERLEDVPCLGVFMTPLSGEEIAALRAEPSIDAEAFVTDVMRRKLLRRTRRWKGELSLKDLENVERRAASAWREMHAAPLFEWVLPNHDGEDSEHWEAFSRPIGDARRALAAFVALLRGEAPEGCEQWDEDLFA